MHPPALPALAIALAFALPGTALAQAHWARFDVWDIERDTTGCTAHRIDGKGATTHFAFRVERPLSMIRLSGKGWRFKPGRPYRIRLSLEGREKDGALFEATGFAGPRGWRGVSIPIDEARAARLWEDHTLAATRDGETAPFARFAPGTWSASPARVYHCAALVAARDPGSGRPAVTPPKYARDRPAVSFDDYLGPAIRDNQQGDVTVRLTISAKGRPSDCTVVRSSGFALLDDRTCLVLSRGMRFEPARDAQGQPTEGRYDQAISWRIPPGWRESRIQE